jgi:beta-N-acetylhexosaminidase
VATTSRRVVHDWLRGKLKFKGLVVTDALDMNAILRLYNGGPATNASAAAAVAVVKAGADVAILPADLDAAYNGLLAAVQRGEIPRAQIDDSVLKILRAKASVGLHRERFADPEALERLVARPESLAFAQQVADAAVTLVRDNDSLLPFPAEGTSGSAATYNGAGGRSGLLAVLFTDDLRNDAGHELERQLLARVPEARVIYVDPANAEQETPAVLDAMARSERVVAAVYAVAQAGRKVLVGGEWKNSVSLAETQSALLEKMLAPAHERLAVVALGNPYLLADFPGIGTYLCTYSDATVSEVSAVKALFGEIPLAGRLPVAIPGLAQAGDGLLWSIKITSNAGRGEAAGTSR